MKIMTRMMTPAALVAFALLSAAPALAQSTREPATTTARVGGQGGSTSAYNSRLMDEVMREFGINPLRLRPRQIERIDETRRILFPSLSPRIHRLNRTQAIAVIYTALVYPRGTGGGRGGRDGWDDGYGYDDDRGPDRPPYDRPGRGNRQCAELDQGIYELLNTVGGEGQMIFLDDEEKERIRSTATRVQRAATDRGFRQVADRAADVIVSMRAFSPSRSVAAERVADLKAAADQACDRGS